MTVAATILLVVVLAIGAIVSIAVASIPAKIASAKGHSWWSFFWFGLFFFPFALATAYLIDPAPARAAAATSQAERYIIAGAVLLTVAVVAFSAFEVLR